MAASEDGGGEGDDDGVSDGELVGCAQSDGVSDGPSDSLMALFGRL